MSVEGFSKEELAELERADKKLDIEDLLGKFTPLPIEQETTVRGEQEIIKEIEVDEDILDASDTELMEIDTPDEEEDFGDMEEDDGLDEEEDEEEDEENDLEEEDEEDEGGSIEEDEEDMEEDDE